MDIERPEFKEVIRDYITVELFRIISTQERYSTYGPSYVMELANQTYIDMKKGQNEHRKTD